MNPHDVFEHMDDNYDDGEASLVVILLVVILAILLIALF